MAGWNRHPAVTTGGKPYYWTRIYKGAHQTVVWRRDVRAWALESSQGTLGYYGTPAAARRAAESEA